MNDELSIHSGTILNADMPTIQNFWLFGVNLQILGGGICSAILVRGGGEKKISLSRLLTMRRLAA